MAEAVILADDFTHEPQPGGIRAIGHGTVNGVRYKVVFQRGEPDEIFITTCYRAARGGRKRRRSKP